MIKHCSSSTSSGAMYSTLPTPIAARTVADKRKTKKPSAPFKLSTKVCQYNVPVTKVPDSCTYLALVPCSETKAIKKASGIRSFDKVTLEASGTRPLSFTPVTYVNCPGRPPAIVSSSSTVVLTKPTEYVNPPVTGLPRVNSSASTADGKTVTTILKHSSSTEPITLETTMTLPGPSVSLTLPTSTTTTGLVTTASSAAATTSIPTTTTVSAQSTVSLASLVARDSSEHYVSDRNAADAMTAVAQRDAVKDKCKWSYSGAIDNYDITMTGAEEVPCATAALWSSKGYPNPMNPLTMPEMVTLIPADVRSYLRYAGILTAAAPMEKADATIAAHKAVNTESGANLHLTRVDLGSAASHENAQDLSTATAAQLASPPLASR